MKVRMMITLSPEDTRSDIDETNNWPASDKKDTDQDNLNDAMGFECVRISKLYFVISILRKYTSVAYCSFNLGGLQVFC